MDDDQGQPGANLKGTGSTSSYECYSGNFASVADAGTFTATDVTVAGVLCVYASALVY